MDTKQIRFLEKTASDGYMPLETMDYDGWRLGFTQGFTGRANSVLLFEPSTIGTEEKVAFCEKTYEAHGLPCIFKLTEADEELRSYLQKRGYKEAKPTDVMILPLGGLKTEDILSAGWDEVRCSEDPADWFPYYFAFEKMEDQTKQDLTREIHAKVAVEKVFIKVFYEGRVAAVASLAISNGYSLLHNVVVDEALRGIGLGEKLCRAAIRKSAECGAGYSFLQVMEDNPVAINLYQKLGFEKQYTYRYVKQA